MSVDQATLSVYRDRVEDYKKLVQEIKNPDLDYFLKCLPNGGCVLDAGAGPGLDAAILKEYGFDVIALEPVDVFADLIEQRGVTTIRDNFDAITQVDKFDGIWAHFSLLHVSRDHLPILLANFHKAMKQDGTFVIGMKLGEGSKRDKLGRLYTYYSTDELIELLTSTGFAVFRKRTYRIVGLAGDKEPCIALMANA